METFKCTEAFGFYCEVRSLGKKFCIAETRSASEILWFDTADGLLYFYGNPFYDWLT